MKKKTYTVCVFCGSKPGNDIKYLKLANTLGQKLAERNFNDSYLKSLISLLIATSIIFILGVGYLGSVIGYDKALAGGLYPFLPSELFKIALAVAIIPSITKFIR